MQYEQDQPSREPMRRRTPNSDKGSGHDNHRKRKQSRDLRQQRRYKRSA